MLIKHIAVRHFRGIETLDWHVDSWLVCLLGPGDSTKTTILDAIELALLPRWFTPISDADFYQTNTKIPIRIEVTLGQLTEEIVHEECCGLFLRGYLPGQPIHDDPEDGYEPVVTVRLQVTDDLEPKWDLVKEKATESQPLTFRDRERFCMARLGDDSERHLTWSRGSALSRITDKAAKTTSTLAVANRATNDAIFSNPNADLEEAAKKVRETARHFGVRLPTLRAGLDVQSSSIGTSALSLHDDRRVPIRASGLGSRRLTGLAIQHEGLGKSSILLIDELEHGLEPHRIRRLIKTFYNDRASTESPAGAAPDSGQVIFTTHSPTPIVALELSHLRFVRNHGGVTTVEAVAIENYDEMQRISRKMSHAFLAKKIIVCEGKTEEALCRALDDVWIRDPANESFACHGVVPVSGDGRTMAPNVAQEIKRLGYDVAYLGDSDAPLSVSAEELARQGVKVFLWEGDMAIEQRACADVTWSALQQIVDIACDVSGAQSVCDVMSKFLNRKIAQSNISDWINEGTSELEVRNAIGKAAKSKAGEWFKNISDGERFGMIVGTNLKEISKKPMAVTIKKLQEWVYAE
jgi:putative ATP-dependent endonuclease of OLD family